MNNTKADFSFSPTMDCNAPCVVTFTNTSVGSGALTYLWNFSDPSSGLLNSSTLKDPSHEYKTAGVYAVTLTTTGSNGSNEIVKTINVGEPIPTFEKSYTASLSEQINDIAELPDGNFIAVGGSYDNFNNRGRALVLKLDNKGNLINTFQVGDFNNTTHANGIALTPDGGFFMGTTVYNKTTSKIEVQIFKISSTNAVQSQFTKVFTADYIEINALHKTNDGGCIFTGVKRQLPTDKNKIWVGRLDANATVIMDITFDGWKGSDIVQTSDGNFVVAAEGETSTNKTIKLSSTGVKIWEDGPYNHAKYIIPYGITLAKDGTYLIGGDAQDFNGGNSFYYAYAVNLNTDKSIKWNQTFGGSDFNFGRSIACSPIGDIGIAGLAGNGTNNDAVFIKTDSKGANSIVRKFGGAKNEAFQKVIATRDGGYIMAGFTYSSGDNGGDAYIVKTDKDGKIN